MDVALKLHRCDQEPNARSPAPRMSRELECTRTSLAPMERAEIVCASAAAAHVSDPGELLSGRWRWVDRFEDGDVRFFVARESGQDRPELTERERTVLAGAAMGRSNKEIAFAIGVAPSTVSSHLVRALRRLGIADVATLIELFSSASDARSVRVASIVFLVVRRPLQLRLGFAGLLTDAENGVAELAAAGLSNLEIAQIRKSSVRTVANQMASILRKLRIGSRRALSIRSPVPAAGAIVSGASCSNLATDPS